MVVDCCKCPWKTASEEDAGSVGSNDGAENIVSVTGVLVTGDTNRCHGLGNGGTEGDQNKALNNGEEI